MLSNLLEKKSLFLNLYNIDKRTAEQYRKKQCPHCGGPLYYANYYRKPRGEPDGTPEECFIQFSLCCGTEGCRRRLKPPSYRFMGKKVYWHAFILVIMSEWQNKKLQEINVFKLSKLFDVSRNTVTRWIFYYKNNFPFSNEWQRIRGQVIASIKSNALPSSLVNHFLSLKSSAQDALVSCIKFLTQGADLHQKSRAG